MANKVATGLWLRCMTIVFALSIATTSTTYADFDRSRVWFTSLNDEDRISLQTNLTLAGYYDAFIDGAFGPSTYRGLTGFQKWSGESVTGVLSDASIRSLSRASDSVINELDLQILQDERGQIELAVPRALLPETSQTSVGTAYTRSDGLMRLDTVRQPYTAQSFEDYFRQLTTENARRNVTYKTLQEGYFVVSGSLDAGFFYSLMFQEDEESVGFTLNWSEPYAKQGSIVSLFLASFATPWTGEGPNVDTTQVQTTAPAPSTALPPTNDAAVIEIGNFLVFKEMPGVIGLRGDIGPSTPLDFRRAVRAVGEPKVLMLASDGGYVSSALLLAYEVRELGLSTYVLPETGCYSACSFVFFAGKERRADGALGVHQVWGDDTDASTAQIVVSDILEAFVDFGVRQEVTSVMLRTRPEDMYVFSQSELTQWGINKGEPMGPTGAAAPDAQSASPSAGDVSTEDQNPNVLEAPIGGPADGKVPSTGSEDGGTHYIQLASQHSEAEARLTAQSMISRFGPIFRGANMEVQRVDMGTKGVYYRVIVPTQSLDDANEICFELIEAGGDCFVL
jgi:peptidoglycan hydrolase-like protein with peptidoglycan-binding domain